MLAQQKMEQLRGLMWGFDMIGLPLSDTTSDLTVVPEQPQGGPGLTPSPDGALRNNFDGYCDFLDGSGQSLGGGMAAPPNTVYVRRWSIEPLPTNPNNTLILQVMVTRWRERGVADTETAGERGAGFPTKRAHPLRENTEGKLMRRHSPEHGFSLIEMTVAMAVMLVVTGSIFALLNPGQGNFVAEPEVADMQQRTRLAADTLYKDLVMVGSGSYEARTRWR